MVGEIRRVVTGHDQRTVRQQCSSTARRRSSTSIRANADDTSTDIWRTAEMPCSIVAEHEEPTMGPRRQMPTPNGTVIRINRFAPESEEVRKHDGRASPRRLFSPGQRAGLDLRARRPPTR